MICRDRRLHLKYINACACDTLFVQCICQRLAVKHRSARKVHKDRIFLHHRNLLRADHAFCLCIIWHMQRNDVRCFHHFIKIHIFDIRDVFYRATVSDHFTTERVSDLCNTRTDRTCTDHAKSLSFQLVSDQTCQCSAVSCRGITCRDISHQRDQHAKHEIRHTCRRIAGTVINHDSKLLAGIHRHMIHTGKRDIQKLAFFKPANRFITERNVCIDHNICVLTARDLLRGILCHGVIINDLSAVTELFLCDRECCFLRDTQWFNHCYFHGGHLSFTG